MSGDDVRDFILVLTFLYICMITLIETTRTCRRSYLADEGRPKDLSNRDKLLTLHSVCGWAHKREKIHATLSSV